MQSPRYILPSKVGLRRTLVIQRRARLPSFFSSAVEEDFVPHGQSRTGGNSGPGR